MANQAHPWYQVNPNVRKCVMCDGSFVTTEKRTALHSNDVKQENGARTGKIWQNDDGNLFLYLVFLVIFLSPLTSSS